MRLLLTIILLLFSTKQAHANPSFYFADGDATVVSYQHSVNLYLNTDGNTLNTAQTAFTFTEDTLALPDTSKVIITNGSCGMAPLDPALGFGTQPSPIIVDNKVYISCGFFNPGFQSAVGGEQIATITFVTLEEGTATLSLSSADTKYYYNASTIGVGGMSDYQIFIGPIIEPTPDPGIVPDTASDTLTVGDLNFVEVGTTGTSTTTTSTTGTSEAVELVETEEDNTIPPPPSDLEIRESGSLLNRLTGGGRRQASSAGEVLSVQSLRELLVPGKSEADRTVVLINLISILTFLIILAILIWKLIDIRRVNKIKNKHMSELLISDLAAIESKLGSPDSSKDQSRADFEETIKNISEELKEKR